MPVPSRASAVTGGDFDDRTEERTAEGDAFEKPISEPSAPIPVSDLQLLPLEDSGAAPPLLSESALVPVPNTDSTEAPTADSDLIPVGDTDSTEAPTADSDVPLSDPDGLAEMELRPLSDWEPTAAPPVPTRQIVDPNPEPARPTKPAVPAEPAGSAKSAGLTPLPDVRPKRRGLIFFFGLTLGLLLGVAIGLAIPRHFPAVELWLASLPGADLLLR